jgi:hypothetical protein
MVMLVHPMHLLNMLKQKLKNKINNNKITFYLSKKKKNFLYFQNIELFIILHPVLNIRKNLLFRYIKKLMYLEYIID